ncbi:Thiol-disulfide oxidoreductase ResA [Mariniflexile rhizosphaerae]|uniref:TlpA family protein disulfide reductase n=1 Tax=unclassified Mariniflexile TaxID=2643887 RepID=UPI000CBE8A6A|nr:TlpA disulfide reductase family protein [Mariniflexile sp. TRM1-10]AXP82576.1 Thiol-disulfide oxidoreductase ResA [Mariniflexile sp. TRM1-10]PLB19585.1 MAG: Redoxin family protein [Flavobacteriaceae bacterium FS1-H7996/R]
MQKLLLLTAAIAIIACKQEPKDYVALSGKIIDKNSDSVVVRSRTFSKTIKVNDDGTFSDTLKVETGVYNFYDGKESTNLFLKNGFDITVTLDTKEFDESVKYSGTGAEHSNFLAENNLMQEELLDLDALGRLDMAELESKFGKIKTELTEFYNANKDIDTSIINSLSKNIDPMLNYYKGYLAESIALKTELPKGAPSPTFEAYENYNGGTTSLSDLKGKYVYIDVWATWCGPCKAEIPSLKALEKQYHDKNIQFVSLSIDDDRSHGGSWDKAREDWKAMIADKELSGVQLLAPNGWQSQFVLDYKIKGIPRFILIDPNGNIVTPDAPRPSSPELTELFTSLNI